MENNKEKLKEYTISDYEVINRYQKTLEDFMIKNSDTIRLTQATSWLEFKFFKLSIHGGERDDRFKKTLLTLEPWFIKKLCDNTRFNNIKQSERCAYIHYYYKIDDRNRTLISSNGIFGQFHDPTNLFYGFEDPTLYSNNTLRFCVISHEPIVIMYLTGDEVNELISKGIKFDGA